MQTLTLSPPSSLSIYVSYSSLLFIIFVLFGEINHIKGMEKVKRNNRNINKKNPMYRNPSCLNKYQV